MMKKKTFKRILKDKNILPERVPVEFDVDGSLEDYISFIKKLRVALANHKDPESMSCIQKSEWRKSHILLPKQIAPEPARWIEIKLSAGEHNTTLFVRDDNVYLVGFENKNKQRYQAGRGCGGRTPKENEKMPDQILEGATPLGYDLNYDGLGGDSSKWNLGMFSAREAVIKLSVYGTKENSSRTPECIRKYLARLILMICEAARMCRIMTRVEEGWLFNGNGGALLTDTERETLNEWVSMSRAMMGWGTYTHGLKNILVKNHDDAGRVVRLIKYAPTGIKVNTSSGAGGDDPRDTSPGGGNGDAPPGDGNGHGTSPEDSNGHGAPPGDGSGDGPPPADRKGKNWQQAPEGNGKSRQRRQQQGRSLVEVSSIHLSEGCTLPDVGSITVFDGKRGQIIYWNEEDADAPRVDCKGDLVLTGPYRAISAGGRVALRITAVSDSDTAEDDLLIWDPYTEDHYDELVSGDITENLTLTYAVLRSAVEVTVQVDVFLFRESDFYGEITACSKLASGEEVSVVLFSRKIEDRVELEPSSVGSTIPLTRSVLSWPVGLPLFIKVVCFHSVSVSHCGMRLRPNVERFFEVEPSFECLEFSSEDHTDKIHVATLKGFGYLRVSADDTGDYREKTNNSLPRSLMNQISPDMSTETCHDLELTLAAECPKLLVVQTSQLRLITFKCKRFIICLLHLTNDSDDQHVAFRCRSVFEGDRQFLESRKWELSGIVPPNSTSAYLVRPYLPPGTDYTQVKSHHLILESCAAWQHEKHVDTIFPASREGIEKVTQSATVSEPADEATTSEQGEDDMGLDTVFGAAKDRTKKVETPNETVSGPIDETTRSEQEEGDEDLDTFFSRPSKGIKEVTIKGTLSHPADVPMTSESDLDVYPLQLHFPFKQDKVICCPLRLTNRTDYYVIFKCLPHTPCSDLYTLDHLNGILLPRSTCTYVVAMGKQKDLPDNMDALSVILKSCTAEKITGPDKYISRQDPMHGPIPPIIEIIMVTGKDYEILSMDVHPTEPWILASHSNGNVSIWDYESRARVMDLSVSGIHEGIGSPIYSAQFIAHEKWIMAGDGDGFIYVVTYTTKDVSKFQAHQSSVASLAVHPNQPIVLSASYDDTIVLWNWDVNRDPIWQRTRTFSGHCHIVSHVMFNPYDNGNTFASASEDRTVKIWRTNDPNDQPKPIATLDCGQDPQQHVAYFSMGGRQYMITGSSKGAARVWDLDETNRPIKELDGPESRVFGCNVGVVNCVPDNTNPVLITVSGDKGISFLDAITYKPRYDKINFGLGRARGFAFIEVKGKRSLAIALKGGIAIMEMNEDPVNSPATVEQAQEGIYSARSSNEQLAK